MSTMQDDDEPPDDDVYESHQQTQPDNTNDPSSSDLPRLHSFVQVSPGKSDLNESLDIEQGENWLRLVGRKSAQTEDTTIGNGSNDAPYPSVLSLEELSTIDKVSSEGCFLCIDVDGPYLAIKDMRSLEVSVPASQQETQTERSTNDGGGNEYKYEYEFRIARKGRSTLVSSALERLARRQLRLLHNGDRLCVLSSVSGDGGGAVTLVLEYRHEVAIRTPVGEAQASQQTMDASVVDDELGVEPPSGSETMALTQPAPADDKITAIPQMSTQPESEVDNYDDDHDDLTVDPDEGSRSNPEGGNAACDTPAKATRSEVCSTPGDLSATLYGETQGPASMDQNGVSKVLPMAVVKEKETLALSGAGAVGINDGEDKEKPSEEAETATMATPQKAVTTASHTASDMFVSPNMMASPCSSEGPSEYETAQDDTVRKEGADAILVSSKASGAVKRIDTDGMRLSDIGKSNAPTALLSPIAHESKVGDKVIQVDVVGAPRVEEAVQEITATRDVETSKEMLSDPSAEKEGFKQTEIDKPHVSVVDEADGTGVLASGKAEDDNAGGKVFGSDVLERPHSDKSMGNIASAGNASASKSRIADPSVVDGAKGNIASCEVANTVNGTNKDSHSTQTSSPHVPEGVEQSGGGETTSRLNGCAWDHVSPPPVAGAAQQDIHQDIPLPVSEVAQQDVDQDVPLPVSEAVQQDTDQDVPLPVQEAVQQDGDQDVPPSVSEAAQQDIDQDVPLPVPEVEQQNVDRDISSTDADGTTTTRSTRGSGQSSTGKEVNVNLVPGEQSDDSKIASRPNGSPLDHVDAPLVVETLQQDVDRDVSSTKTGGTTTKRSTRRRGRSSPTEEVARGITSADHSVHATARVTRKRGRGVSSEEGDSKREPEEQNGDNEATAGASGDACNHAIAPPVGETTEQDNDRGSSSTKAEGVVTTAAKSKRKRGRSSPGGEIDTKPDVVATPEARPRSARKQPRLTSTPTVTDDAVAGDVPIRVLTTRIELKQKEKNVSLRFCLHGRYRLFLVSDPDSFLFASQMIKRLGGVLLEDINDAHTATHVISTDGTESIRRTPKLMIGICRTRNIVNKQWLLDSSKQGRSLPCDDFLILNDTEAEAKYDFSMRDTLERISSNIEQGTSLLGGWWIYVCKGVAGNKAPSEEELKLIVEAAGGTWLSSLNPSGMKDVDASRLLMVTGDPETKKQLSPKPVASALRSGAVKQTTSWLFHAIMTQHLDLPTAPKM